MGQVRGAFERGCVRVRLAVPKAMRKRLGDDRISTYTAVTQWAELPCESGAGTGGSSRDPKNRRAQQPSLEKSLGACDSRHRQRPKAASL